MDTLDAKGLKKVLAHVHRGVTAKVESGMSKTIYWTDIIDEMKNEMLAEDGELDGEL